MKWMATVALAVAAAGSAGGQVRKVDTPPPPSVITVEGCVRGSSLERLWGASTAPGHASEYVIDGRTELVQAIKRGHDGHHLEITGELIIPPKPATEKTKVDTIDLGRGGRVTVGTRQHAGLIAAPPQPVRIVVESFKHLADKCVSAR